MIALKMIEGTDQTVAVAAIVISAPNLSTRRPRKTLEQVEHLHG